MRKRLCAALLILSILLCSACGLWQNSEECSSRADTISFSWWGNDERHQYTMDGLDTFMEKNPDIKIDMQYGVWSGFEKRNKMVMKSHTEADVMQINYAWLTQYSNDGNGYYDLATLSDIIDLNNFDVSDLENGMKNGKLNAIPIAYNSYAFFYNKDIYDKYGLEIPKTWDDLFAAAKVMKKDGIYPLGTVKKQVFSLMIAHFEQSHNKTVFNANGKLNIDAFEMAEIFSYYKQLIESKVLCPIGDFDRNAYLSGKVAGTICWISDASNYADSLEEAGYQVALGRPLTTFGAKMSGWYMKPATMYAISANTENPEAAARLLNYLLNDEDMTLYQKTEKGVPISKSAMAALEKSGDLDTYEYKATTYLRQHIESYGKVLPVMEDPDIIETFKCNGDDYIYEKISLEECAHYTVVKINDIIEKSK